MIISSLYMSSTGGDDQSVHMMVGSANQRVESGLPKGCAREKVTASSRQKTVSRVSHLRSSFLVVTWERRGLLRELSGGQ